MDHYWVVVASGGRRFIGKALNLIGEDASQPRVTLNEALEIQTITRQVPQRHPATGEQVMMLQRETMVFPVDACASPISLDLYGITERLILRTLDASDRNTYEMAYAVCLDNLQAARAQRAGIALPNSGVGRG